MIKDKSDKNQIKDNIEHNMLYKNMLSKNIEKIIKDNKLRDFIEYISINKRFFVDLYDLTINYNMRNK
uniref:Uncharacterized protein n=1 Tax=viral metagenome TaxID=1070528 RepID=A0A6C0JEX4_9ZZZZ